MEMERSIIVHAYPASRGWFQWRLSVDNPVNSYRDIRPVSTRVTWLRPKSRIRSSEPTAWRSILSGCLSSGPGYQGWFDPETTIGFPGERDATVGKHGCSATVSTNLIVDALGTRTKEREMRGARRGQAVARQ